jgi:hypothetical protein
LFWANPVTALPAAARNARREPHLSRLSVIA